MIRDATGQEHRFSGAVMDSHPPIHACVCGFKGELDEVKRHLLNVYAIVAARTRKP